MNKFDQYRRVLLLSIYLFKIKSGGKLPSIRRNAGRFQLKRGSLIIIMHPP